MTEAHGLYFTWGMARSNPSSSWLDASAQSYGMRFRQPIVLASEDLHPWQLPAISSLVEAAGEAPVVVMLTRLLTLTIRSCLAMS